MSRATESAARRAYLVSKKTRKAIADRESAKVKPKASTEKAPQPKVQKKSE